VTTGAGDDIVQIRGRLGGNTPIFIFLDSGNDTLIGDPELAPASFNIVAFGGKGTDMVINASYFTTAFNSELLEFETLDD
jgi:Ca2+-binding RTX toxin-like protein